MAGLFPPVHFSAVENNEIQNKWNGWIKNVEEAHDVEKPLRKKSLLLELGGIELKRIFDSIPGADVQRNKDGKNPFEIAVIKITDFLNYNNTRKRNLFWKLKPNRNETMTNYIHRVKQIAKLCNFTEQDKYIHDQVALVARPKALQEKLLELEELDFKKLEEICLFYETIQEPKVLNSQNVPDQDFPDINKLSLYSDSASAPKPGEFYKNLTTVFTEFLEKELPDKHKNLDRKLICQKIINFFIQNKAFMFHTSFEHAAAAIVRIFPEENEATYYTRSSKGKPASGSLYNKYNTTTGKMRKEGTWPLKHCQNKNTSH